MWKSYRNLPDSQVAFTCSNSTMETPEKWVKSV